MAITRNTSSRTAKRKAVANRSSRAEALEAPISRRKPAPAKRGFAAMSVQKRRAIAAKGGRARKAA